jgi:hypothetical protein
VLLASCSPVDGAAASAKYEAEQIAAGFTANPDHKEQQDIEPPVPTECRLDPLSSEAADSRKEPRDSIAFRGKGTD